MAEKKIKYLNIEETQIAKDIVRDDIDGIIAACSKLDAITISTYQKAIIERDDADYHLLFNSTEQPYVFLKAGVFVSTGFHINPEYYATNRETSAKDFARVIANFTGETLFVRVELDSVMIEAIVNNPNIKTIYLRDLPLTKKLYEELTVRSGIQISSDSIDPSLEEIFDGSIYENLYRTLVQTSFGMNYEQLVTASHLRFTNPISKKELDYLKKFAKNVKEIVFEATAFSSIREIASVFEPETKITINLDRKKKYDLDSLIKLQNLSTNIEISYAHYTVSLSQYIKTQQKVMELLNPIKDLNLSPLEKYLFAFQTAAKFRKYQENIDDPRSARNLFRLFEDGNTDIVCVGFANILRELCLQLDIECENIGLKVDVSHDKPDEEILQEQQKMKDALNQFVTIVKNKQVGELSCVDLIQRTSESTPISTKRINHFIKWLQDNLELKHAEEIEAEIANIIKEYDQLAEGHQRNRIYIKDEKYGVDGIFVADATWSNYMEHDIFVHALMTPQETLHQKRMIYSNEMDLFSAQTYEEFIECLYLEFRTKEFSLYSKTELAMQTIFPDFKEWQMQFSEYQKFSAKVGPDIEDYRQLFSDDMYMRALFERIYHHSNNIISGETIIEAAMNLHNALNPDISPKERDDRRFKLIRENRHVYGKSFPQIIIEGNKTTFIRANERNKYEMTNGYYVAPDNSLWQTEEDYMVELKKKAEGQTAKTTFPPSPPHLVNEYYVEKEGEEINDGARKL